MLRLSHKEGQPNYRDIGSHVLMGSLGILMLFNKNWDKKLPKFGGKNAITCEDELRCFLDVMSDYEVEFEDVMMKLFV